MTSFNASITSISDDQVMVMMNRQMRRESVIITITHPRGDDDDARCSDGDFRDFSLSPMALSHVVSPSFFRVLPAKLQKRGAPSATCDSLKKLKNEILTRNKK